MNNHRTLFLILLSLAVLLLLTITACSSSPSATASSPGGSTTIPPVPPGTTSLPATAVPPVLTPAPGQQVTLDLVTQNMAFDKAVITVPAGAQVTINFTNKDKVGHNFAAYTNEAAATSIFIGQIINGPSTIIYTFTAPTNPGAYFFRCDPHPNFMKGQFIVQ